MNWIKLYIIPFLILINTACTSHNDKQKVIENNNVTQNSCAFIYMKEDLYDAGKIIQGAKVNHSFLFENKGKCDLVIINVQASCGCTIAKWDKKPIPSGKSSSIDVTFNSERKFGPQKKIITIVSNGYPVEKRVELDCEVIKPIN